MRLIPLKNPGAITVPLSFAVGIAVSLLWPELEAARRFAELEQHVLLGTVTEPEPEPRMEPAAPSGARAAAH